MSISELQNTGVAHSWANLRVNNLFIDSDLTAGNFIVNDVSADNLTVDNALMTDTFTANSGTITDLTTTSLLANTFSSVEITANNLRSIDNYSMTGAQNYNIILQKCGQIQVNTIGEITVYTFPISPTIGGSYYFDYIINAKGGPVGNTSNFMFQRTTGYATSTNAGFSSLPYWPGVNENHFQGFVVGVVGQNVTLVGNNLQFQVHNNAAGQTTDFSWTITMYSLQTSL